MDFAGRIRNKTGGKRVVVDSGASMHMVSRKDLNSAELETESPMTVVTANGEVPTKEEATVHVRELELLVTVKLLEDTPAVLSLGKIYEDHRKNTIGPVVSNHISSKMTERSIATQRTTYPSLSLVYRQALQPHLHLLLQHLHRRKP